MITITRGWKTVPTLEPEPNDDALAALLSVYAKKPVVDDECEQRLEDGLQFIYPEYDNDPWQG